MPHDHYQTVKEVAERLKVAEATVRATPDAVHRPHANGRHAPPV